MRSIRMKSKGHRPPRTYLEETLVGRVHRVNPKGLRVTAYFWEEDNLGVSDGRADGYLGDAEIKIEVGANYKIGDKIQGKVSRGLTMTRMSQELTWQLLHMTREQRAEFSKDWSEERRQNWEQHLNGERERWQIGLEFAMSKLKTNPSLTLKMQRTITFRV
jgi:hypothetical protein